MTEYKNVSKAVMAHLDKLENEGKTEEYNKVKDEHGIVDIYDLIWEREWTIIDM